MGQCPVDEQQGYCEVYEVYSKVIARYTAPGEFCGAQICA